MWSPPPNERIFVCLLPTDLRRSFDGLAGLVEGILREDPVSGHLFVFRNRRSDLIKILYWDHSGYARANFHLHDISPSLQYGTDSITAADGSHKTGKITGWLSSSQDHLGETA